MSEPESGKENVNTVYFVNQARGNTRMSRTVFVRFVYNERVRNCKCLLIFELPAWKMFIKNILLQISFYA